jgi:hypothetical protein
MSPDPYHGSYDVSNPQSFNRYAYVNNNPLGAIDHSGLMEYNGPWDDGGGYCPPDLSYCGDDPFDPIGPVGPPENTVGGLNTTPAPAPPVKDPYNGPLWTDHGGFQPSPYSDIASGLWDLLGLPTSGCEFGSCGSGFQQGNVTAAGDAAVWAAGYLDNRLSALIFSKGNMPAPYLFFGSHHCGPGGSGAPTTILDQACATHDTCYNAAGINADGNTNANIPWTAFQTDHAYRCNYALYRAARAHPDVRGSRALQLWLTWGDQFGILRKGTSIP